MIGHRRSLWNSKISHKAQSTQAKSSGVLCSTQLRLSKELRKKEGIVDLNYRGIILCTVLQCNCKGMIPFNPYPFLGFWPQVIDEGIAWSNYKDRVMLRTQVF